MRNSLKGLRMLGVLAMIMCVMLSSCNNDDDVFSAPVEESSMESSDSLKISTKASVAAVGSVSPLEALKGREFTFTLTGPTSTLTNSRVVVYVRFTAPSGDVIDQAMSATGTSGSNTIFTHKRMLSQYGKYDVDFGYKLDGGSFQSLQPNYYAVVLHPEISQTNSGYPYTYGDETKYDKWDFNQKYCTSWVAWSVNKMWNTEKTFHNNSMGVHLGNASNWKSALSSLGYIADNYPRVGDIAWWNTNHVAFVNKVQSNGTIIITEYNYPPNYPLMYNCRTIAAGASNYPHSFIHVQTKRH